jgi:hypothetical protein
VRLAESITDSGLVLLEGREDGAQVARELRRYDPALCLRVDVNGLWRVYRTVGSEHRDVFICAWQDAGGVPLPLSMRLLDKIKQLDRNTRSPAPDPDELNARLRRETERQYQSDTEAIISEVNPILEGKRNVSMVVRPEHKEKLC